MNLSKLSFICRFQRGFLISNAASVAWRSLSLALFTMACTDSSGQGLAQSCNPPLAVEYKTVTLTDNMAGWDEFDETEPPKIKMYKKSTTLRQAVWHNAIYMEKDYDFSPTTSDSEYRSVVLYKSFEVKIVTSTNTELTITNEFIFDTLNGFDWEDFFWVWESIPEEFSESELENFRYGSTTTAFTDTSTQFLFERTNYFTDSMEFESEPPGEHYVERHFFTNAHSFLQLDLVEDRYWPTDFISYLTNRIVQDSWPANWSDIATNASTKLSEDETEAECRKMQYRLSFTGEAGREYTLNWIERFTAASGGVIVDTPRSEVVAASGKLQYTGTYTNNPPLQEGTITVVVPSTQSPGDCESCTPGSGFVANNSVHLRMNLGRVKTGASAGTLFVHEEYPTNTLGTSASLRLETTSSDVIVIRESGVMEQIKAPEAFVDISYPASGATVINFYHPADVSDVPGESFTPTGEPFVTWQIANIQSLFAQDGPCTNLIILESREGSSEGSFFNWTGTNNGWAMGTGAPTDDAVDAIRWETRSKLVGAGGTNETETLTISNQTNGIAYKEVQKYRIYPEPLGRHLTERTVDPDGAALTTTLTYYDSVASDGRKYGRPKQVIEPNGRWKNFEYDSAGRLSKEIAGFLNVPPGSSESDCRVTEYAYTPVVTGDDGSIDPDVARTIVEKVRNQEVSRRYYAALPGEKRDIRCTTASATPTDTNNLVTSLKHYTNGPFVGRPFVTDRPDGTREVSFYATNAAYVTNIVLVGEASTGSSTNLAGGSKTVHVTTQVGQNVLRLVSDIESSLLVESETYTNLDLFGRPQTILYLDGTRTEVRRECCGTTGTVDRDSRTNSFIRDLLGNTTEEQVTLNSSNVIRTVFTHDPLGNILSSTRYGTDNSAIGLGSSKYDLAGRLTSSIDALGFTNTFLEAVSTNGTVRTTVYPDGGTRIETYARDGTLLSVTGTAVRPAVYTNGVENGFYFTKEIKLDTNGAPTDEWIKTYFDLLGRSVKAIYPDTAFSETVYNSKGQVIREIDPDGVVTLLTYNPQGELAYTVLDTDRDGEIDWSGSDRIVRNTNDVTTSHGLTVRRTRRYEWAEEGQNNSRLAETLESSAGSLQSWRTVLNTTSHWETVYSSNGVRTVTKTAPDNSTRINGFSYGRPISETQFNASQAQLGAKTYGYDTHSRVRTVTDARTGAVTNGYNNADQLVSTATEAAAGVASQVTSYDLDGRGRMRRIVLPDGASVTNEYSPAGDLLRTTGARVYPQGYTYDSQGRIKTLTTWTNYASGSGAAVTTWNYDGQRGWATNKVYAGSVAGPGYTYTAAGRLRTRTWARNVTTTYSYNNAGELETVVYSDATPNVTNAYERLGRLKTVSQGSNVCNYTYNEIGQLTGDSSTAGLLEGLSVTNNYDGLFRRTNLQFRIAGSAQFNHGYAYDGASRLSSVAVDTNNVTYGYLTNSSLVEQLQFKQGAATRMTTTKSYDKLDRLLSVASVNSQLATVASFSYGYNAASQRTSVTNVDNSRWSFAYDSLGQVTSGKKYWSDSTPVAGQQFEYLFDDIGNRRQTKAGGDASGSSLRTGSYAPNALNQYSSRTVPGAVDVIGAASTNALVTVNDENVYRKSEYFRAEMTVSNTTGSAYPTFTNIAVIIGGTNGADIATNWNGNIFVPAATETFSYDADGNLTSDGRWTNRWDAENRLISMESLSSNPSNSWRKLVFNYDYQGRRISKTASNWTGSTWSNVASLKYAYDAWNLIAKIGSSNILGSSFAWGTDLSAAMQGAGGVGGLVTATDHTTFPSSHSFFGYDANGNVALIVNTTNGAVTSQYEYGPSGEIIQCTGIGAESNPFRFSTKYQDEESDLLYYGYRYLNAATGRWLTRDPIGDEAFLKHLRWSSKRHRKLITLQRLDPAYAWLGNNGVNDYDYLGLSGRDVLKIWAIFVRTLHYYCDKCIRCDMPNLGNMLASVPWTSNRGCTWQALDMHKRLLNNFTFKSDATWTLDTPNNGAMILVHNWVSADSDDPDDPKVELDTWRGCMTVTFPNAPQASWKRCFRCPPYVPNESYPGPEYGP